MLTNSKIRQETFFTPFISFRFTRVGITQGFCYTDRVILTVVFVRAKFLCIIQSC